MPHVIPDELVNLSLYRQDEKLCAGWVEAYAVWRETYKGINVLQEVRKAHAWEICNPTQRKTQRLRFLNNWLSKAHTDWHRRQQEQGLRFVGRYIPPSNQEVKCKTCMDSGLVPSKIKTRWGEERPAMARCSACAFQKAAQ